MAGRVVGGQRRRDEFTFHLRDDVTFSDGTPFTADVVKANFDDIIANGAKANARPPALHRVRRVDRRRSADRDGHVQRAERPVPPGGVDRRRWASSAPSTLALPFEERATARPRRHRPVHARPRTPRTAEVVLAKRPGYAWAPDGPRQPGRGVPRRDRLHDHPRVERAHRRLQSGQVAVIGGVPPQDIETPPRRRPLARRPGPTPASCSASAPMHDQADRPGRRRAPGDRRWRSTPSEVRDAALSPTSSPSPTSVLSQTTPSCVDLQRLARPTTPRRPPPCSTRPAGRSAATASARRTASSWTSCSAGSPTSGPNQTALEFIQAQLAAAGIAVDAADRHRARVPRGPRVNGAYDLAWGNLSRADGDVLRTPYSGGHDLLRRRRSRPRGAVHQRAGRRPTRPRATRSSPRSRRCSSSRLRDPGVRADHDPRPRRHRARRDARRRLPTRTSSPTPGCRREVLRRPAADEHARPGDRARGRRRATVLGEALREAPVFEDLGFDAYAIGEHHINDAEASSPPVILGYIAASTTRLRLFTGVTVLPLLDPVRVAEDYATLDVISGGRVEIIIGKGNTEEQSRVFGYTNDDQWDRNAEKYELLRRLLREEDVTWAGRYRPPLERVHVAAPAAAAADPHLARQRHEHPLDGPRGEVGRPAVLGQRVRPARAVPGARRRLPPALGRLRTRPGRRARRRRLGRAARPRATRSTAVEEFRPELRGVPGLRPGQRRCRGSSRRWRTPSPAARTSSAARSRCSSRSTATTTRSATRSSTSATSAASTTRCAAAASSCSPPRCCPCMHDDVPRPPLGRPARRRPRRLSPTHHQEDPMTITTTSSTRRSAAPRSRRQGPHIGTEIRGLDLDAASTTPTKDALRRGFAARKVLVFRGAQLSPAQHVEAVQHLRRAVRPPDRRAPPRAPARLPVRGPARRARPAAGTSAGCGARRCSGSSRSSTRSSPRSAATRSGPTCRPPTTTCRSRSRSSSRSVGVRYDGNADQLRAGRDARPQSPTRPCIRSCYDNPRNGRKRPVPQHDRRRASPASASGGPGAARLPDRPRVAAEVPGPLQLGRRRLRAVGQPGHVARRRRRLRRRATGLPQGHRRMPRRHDRRPAVGPRPRPDRAAASTPARPSPTPSTSPAAPRRPGYRRYWVAEHHLNPGVAGTSPALRHLPRRRRHATHPRRVGRRADGPPHAAVGRRAVRHRRRPAPRAHRPRPRPLGLPAARRRRRRQRRPRQPTAPPRGC